MKTKYEKATYYMTIKMDTNIFKKYIKLKLNKIQFQNKLLFHIK